MPFRLGASHRHSNSCIRHGLRLLLCAVLLGSLFGCVPRRPVVHDGLQLRPSSPTPPPTTELAARVTEVILGGQIIATNRDNVIAILDRIEFLDNGRMRWHVGVFNRSGRDERLAYDIRRSYLADPSGNRYGVLASSYQGQMLIQPGIRVDHWFEFREPIFDARAFTARLLRAGGTITIPPFEVLLTH